jgi:alpha/beta hydrolase fold-3 domain protein
MMSKPNLAKPVADFVKSLEKSGAKPLYELTPQEARSVLLEVQKNEGAKPEAKIDEVNVPLENGREMKALIVRPTDVDDTLPIIFYIHGGGWVMGNEVTHDRLIRQLADEVPAAVVFPVYTPSPEAQYPQTTNDLFMALNYISEYGAKYNLDATRLIVAGDSVGGNMAAVMALMAKNNKNLPNIDFQLLFYPVTDASFDTESYHEFAEGPWLTKKAMIWFWKQYAPDESKREEIYACPLRATTDELAGLPPALVITDENDVLRDEGEAYAQKLSNAGVQVGAVRVNGTIHDFVMLNALADTIPTKIAIELAVRVLQDVLASLEDNDNNGED